MEVLPTFALPIKITFDVFFDSSRSCERSMGPLFFGLSIEGEEGEKGLKLYCQSIFHLYLLTGTCRP